MKRRFRKTGEIVDIISYNSDFHRDDLDYVSYIDSNGLEHSDVKGLNWYWDFEEIEEANHNNSDIDWEQRRYEIAKTVVASLSKKIGDGFVYEDYVVETALYIADKLIEKLKKKDL